LFCGDRKQIVAITLCTIVGR